MRHLTLGRTLGIITVLLLFAIATRIPIDTDTWWHIRSGEYTLTQGMITADPFSHTYAGERWINHSWGAQLVLYAAYTLAGDVGLSLFTAALAVVGTLAIAPVLRGNIYVRAFVLVLAAATASVFWAARPQMFSYAFSGVTLWVLYSHKDGQGTRLWWLVPLMWLWGNLHAGYSIGFIFMGAFLAGELLNRWHAGQAARFSWRSWRGLLLVTVACVGVLLLTPYGAQTLLVPFETVGMDALRRYIQEWNSPNFQGRETWLFIVMLMALFAFAWLARLTWDWTGFFLVAGTCFMALLYGRNIAVFAVAAAPLLSRLVDAALTERGLVLRPRRATPTTARLNALFVAAVAIGLAVYVLGAVWSPSAIRKAQEDFLPVNAVRYLRENALPRQVFNSYNWGGYLLFAAPEYPVFIDGRTDLYNAFLRTYLETTAAVGDWRAVLAQYDVQTVLIERGVALDFALRDEPGWREVYRDDLAVIFVRDAQEAGE